MRAIVTVKLARNPRHNPYKKQTGTCPLVAIDSSIENARCTDVTGSHHSYIETGEHEDQIWAKVRLKFGHVTRIEIIPGGTEEK